MAIAIVGSSALTNQNNASTNAVSSTRTLTAGNCAIALAVIVRTTTFTVNSATDGAGNTWNLLTVGTADTTGVFCRVALAYALNVTGGATTVSFNLSSTAATFSNCGMSEFSGVAVASAQDATATNSEINTAGGTDASAGPITTTEAGDLLFGVMGLRSTTDTAANFASPANWTSTHRQNNASTPGQSPGLDAGYWLPGSVQTNYTAQWSHDNNANDEAAAVIVALKALTHLHRIIGGGGNRVIS